MDALLRDLRYALRSLRARPLFAVVAALSLAIGIGANTAIFSVVNALLLRPLPGIGGQERVVELGRGRDRQGFDTFSWPDFVDVREGAPALEDAAAWRSEAMALSRGGEGERVSGLFVTPSYFDVLGLSPHRGRFFAADEAEGVGEHPVAVLGYGFWRDRLGGDPGVVGSTIRLNRLPYTVVGVAPPEFRGHMIGLSPDVMVPMVQFPTLGDGRDFFDRRSASWHHALGRLAPGATVDELNRQLAALAARLEEAHPETNEGRTFSALPLGPVPGGGRGPVRAFLAVLTGLVALILVVTCANVAGMFLARATSREREVAVRLAMGAGRSALVRQLTVESLVVFAVGGALGIGLAAWAVGLLRPDLLPADLPVRLDFSPDRRVLAVGMGVTLLTGLVFGLLPALRATRVDLLGSLKDEGRGGGGRRGSRMRKVFVTAQVGLSLVLLASAGLFLRSLQRASEVETGFDPADAYMTRVDLSLEGYDAEAGRLFQRALLERIRETPGVGAAALGNDLPLDMAVNGTSVVPEGWGDAERGLGVDFNRVSPGYFRTLGIPLLRGRGFAPSDGPDTERVVVVSRTFAREAWPGEGALGRRVTLSLDGEDVPWTVVGVVEDVKNSMITDPAGAFVYFPLAQWYTPSAHLVVRARGGMAAVAPALRRAVLEADPSLSLTPVVSLERYTSVGILPQRLAAGLTTGLGLLALLLSGIGIYGVVAYAVARRTREMGVRIALGAETGQLLGLVLRGGLALALPGLAVGALLAVGVGHAMRGFLLGLSPVDPVALGSVAAVLLGVVLLASFVPARRAAGVDPVAALRSE